MPLTIPINVEQMAACMRYKFSAGPTDETLRTPCDPPMRKLMYNGEMKYHYTLLGLYPSETDNRQRCFCKAPSALRAVDATKWELCERSGSVKHYMFYWGCCHHQSRCGFCVPCGLDGIPYRVEGSKSPFVCHPRTRAPIKFHFGFCSTHSKAVALFHAHVPCGASRTYTLFIEQHDKKFEISWDLRKSNGFPVTFFICPGAQRMECGHMFVIVRRCLTPNACEERLVKVNELSKKPY